MPSRMSNKIEADRLLALGANAEREGNTKTAFEAYQNALQLLMNEMKLVGKGSDYYNELLAIVTAYMGIAERLKVEMTAVPVTVPVSQQSPRSETRTTTPTRGKSANVADDFDYTAIAASRKIPVKKPSSLSPKRGIKAAVTPVKTVNNKTTDVKSKPKTSEYDDQIMSEMLDTSPGVSWTSIAGLAFAKQTLQETIILPNLRPDLFTGLRAPPRGVLLYGPPGTGKTLLARAVATESHFSFFCITSSSVTSKYLGEGEKLMKALFNAARSRQPAVIFFDEIDALMSARKDSEHEASRRLKTEFMTQVDGAATSAEDRLLIMAATNLPWAIDEAVLRRLVKRLYVPLPDDMARSSLICHQLSKQIEHQSPPPPPQSQSQPQPLPQLSSAASSMSWPFSSASASASGSNSVQLTAVGLSAVQLARVVQLTSCYSGSDLTAVCHEAAMGPIRELGAAALRTVKSEDIRQVSLKDFEASLLTIRPSVSPDSLEAYVKWSEQYGVAR